MGAKTSLLNGQVIFREGQLYAQEEDCPNGRQVTQQILIEFTLCAQVLLWMNEKNRQSSYPQGPYLLVGSGRRDNSNHKQMKR